MEQKYHKYEEKSAIQRYQKRHFRILRRMSHLLIYGHKYMWASSRYDRTPQVCTDVRTHASLYFAYYVCYTTIYM